MAIFDVTLDPARQAVQAQLNAIQGVLDVTGNSEHDALAPFMDAFNDDERALGAACPALVSRAGVIPFIAAQTLQQRWDVSPRRYQILKAVVGLVDPSTFPDPSAADRIKQTITPYPAAAGNLLGLMDPD